jgi:hypothetical protein
MRLNLPVIVIAREASWTKLNILETYTEDAEASVAAYLLVILGPKGRE